MSSPSSPRRLTRTAARWGLPAVTLLLGLTLAGSALLSYRDLKHAARAMTREQGAGLLRRLVADQLRPGLRRLDPPQALEELEDLGLRYVAVYREGELVGQAGTPRGTGLPLPGQVEELDGRVRMASSPRRAAWGVPGAGRMRGAPLVIEYEPLAAEEVRWRRTLGLLVSLGAALVLSAAGLAFWGAMGRMHRMERELEHKRHLADLGEMSAVLAHEIRNPLASLKGHAQLLVEELPDESGRGRASRVVDEAVRLESLTNDLTAFVRSGVAQRAPTSPVRVLEAARAATSPDRVKVDGTGAPESFSLDAGRIEQALANLLRNALEVTPADRTVEAEARAEGEALVFRVRDHGPGVPGSERDRIFEPFHTTKVKGTGLGLAITRRIVEAHGGRIDVADAPGGGAIFRVVIPPGGHAASVPS